MPIPLGVEVGYAGYQDIAGRAVVPTDDYWGSWVYAGTQEPYKPPLSPDLQKIIDARKSIDWGQPGQTATIVNPLTGQRESAYMGFGAHGFDGTTQNTTLFLPESIARSYRDNPGALPSGVYELMGGKAYAPFVNTMGTESGLDKFMENQLAPLLASAVIGGGLSGMIPTNIPGPTGLSEIFSSVTGGAEAAGAGAGYVPEAAIMQQAVPGALESVAAEMLPTAVGGASNLEQVINNSNIPGVEEFSGIPPTNSGAAPIETRIPTPTGNTIRPPNTVSNVLQTRFGMSPDMADKLATIIPGAGTLNNIFNEGSTTGYQGNTSAGTGGNNGDFPWGDVLGSLLSAYGANQGNKDLADAMKYAVDKADPFAAQRPFYQDQFKQQYTDPNYFTNNAVFKGLRDDALNTTERRLASQGYNMSGNMMHDLTKTATNTGYQYAMPFMDMTGKAAGAFQGPGYSGLLAGQAGQAQQAGNNSMYGALGYGLQSIFNGGTTNRNNNQSLPNLMKSFGLS